MVDCTFARRSIVLLGWWKNTVRGVFVGAAGCQVRSATLAHYCLIFLPFFLFAGCEYRLYIFISTLSILKGPCLGLPCWSWRSTGIRIRWVWLSGLKSAACLTSPKMPWSNVLRPWTVWALRCSVYRRPSEPFAPLLSLKNLVNGNETKPLSDGRLH